MQRLHHDDLAGELVRAGTHLELRLPMRYEADNPCETPFGKDPRTVDGELLCPQRINDATVTTLETVLGPDDAAAQLQQRPSRKAGKIFRRSWFKHYDALPVGVVTWIQVWDMNFKGTEGSDFVSGQIWCVARDLEHPTPRDAYYLVDRFNDRESFPGVIAKILEWSVEYPLAYDVILEDAANGPAVEQLLRAQLPGIQLSKTQGGKEARAHAISHLYKEGRVYHPRAPWVAKYEEQMERFPKAAHDDDVDATAHGLLFLHRSNLGTFAEAMAAFLAKG
jgi:predicted phage terminase large subunit-like protein